jgi:hypothetical protein
MIVRSWHSGLRAAASVLSQIGAIIKDIPMAGPALLQLFFMHLVLRIFIETAFTQSRV